MAKQNSWNDERGQQHEREMKNSDCRLIKGEALEAKRGGEHRSAESVEHTE